MTRVNHHISDELLLAYAAGNLSEGWSLAIATHLALCPECRSRLAEAESVGGAMLEALQPESVGADALEKVMGRLDKEPPAAKSETRAASDGDATIYPEPLRSYLGGGKGLRWRRLGTAQQVRVSTGDQSTTVRLLKIPGGQPMPVHGHRGLELTLVLSGSFSDEHGTFRRGDIEEADEDIEHQPIADPGEDCYCLAVTDAPLRFRGIARLLQPFLRI